MSLDPQRLEEITRLAVTMKRGEDNLDNVGDLANAVPELLAEVERLQELVATARFAMVEIGRGTEDPDNAELIDSVTKNYDEVLAKLEAEPLGGGSKYTWSDGDVTFRQEVRPPGATPHGGT